MAPDPTYKNMGDHTEAVEVIYDPKRVSYEKLLDVFWSAHDPTTRVWSRQYRNAVFVVDEKQEAVALRRLGSLRAVLGDALQTDVEPLGSFYPAEGYHQKYALRGHKELFAELVRQYGTEQRALDSTAAARLNGYLGGYGNRKDLEENMTNFGLGHKGRTLVLDAVGERLR